MISVSVVASFKSSTPMPTHCHQIFDTATSVQASPPLFAAKALTSILVTALSPVPSLMLVNFKTAFRLSSELFEM